MPLPTALAVASLPRSPERVALFAYERDAEMAGKVAPARRVSLFLSDEAPPFLTPLAWSLFDAAIRWAAARPE
jgi:hypothetical protein